MREGVRDKTNHYVTGRDGGRDIDLRQRALEGMELYGRLLDVTGERLVCATDLANCLDQADEVSESIKTSVDGFIAKKAVAAPAEDRYRPAWTPLRDATAIRASISPIRKTASSPGKPRKWRPAISTKSSSTTTSSSIGKPITTSKRRAADPGRSIASKRCAKSPKTSSSSPPRPSIPSARSSSRWPTGTTSMPAWATTPRKSL